MLNKKGKRIDGNRGENGSGREWEGAKGRSCNYRPS